MKQGDSTVREYNTLFLKSGHLEIHQQETLVMMYRDGLREEIRAELGVHVFSTIDDIMQAALDVEEGDESDESGNRSKEKSRSGECETSGDTDCSTTESDKSGNRTKKNARTGEDFLQNLDGEEEDPTRRMTMMLLTTVTGLFRRGSEGAMRNPIVRLILKTIRSTLRNITGASPSQVENP
ncbi:unnamed protein product, partial [Brassica oleracea var. botrytis]